MSPLNFLPTDLSDLSFRIIFLDTTLVPDYLKIASDLFYCIYSCLLLIRLYHSQRIFLQTLGSDHVIQWLPMVS